MFAANDSCREEKGQRSFIREFVKPNAYPGIRDLSREPVVTVDVIEDEHSPPLSTLNLVFEL